MWILLNLNAISWLAKIIQSRRYTLATIGYESLGLEDNQLREYI